MAGDRLADWGLLPTRPNWAKGFETHWTPGEDGARARLQSFIEDGLAHYADDRDRPDLDVTSRLSPHLHFGEISPAQCWHAVRAAQAQAGGKLDRAAEKFLKEVLWREFSYHLLHHWPTLPSEPFRPEFAAFPWSDNPEGLSAWQKGQTGYPIVDAGMRELWATGIMHNRVRMIAASFLIKDLLVPWQQGEQLVLGHAGRCRHRQQCRELAVGGGLRCRCRALFPHLQSGAAGREVRPEGRLCAQVGAGTVAPAG